MNYQTFEPGKKLSAFVKCYWLLEGPAQENPQRQTIVPDGCMEMIFHYGDLYKQYTHDGQHIIQPRSFVFGQLTQPLEIEPVGATALFSVRFHPEGFVPFATLPLKEMEDRAISLDVIFGKEGAAIENQLLQATTTEERITLIESFLLERLTDANTIDRIVKETVATIVTANGQLSVDALLQQTKTSRRQLERKFASVIGLSPKKLSKTIRLQAMLKMLLNKEVSSLTALAYEGDYYDQAHFTKDFKEFTGFTPKEFYGDHLQMSSLFYGSD